MIERTNTLNLRKSCRKLVPRSRVSWPEIRWCRWPYVETGASQFINVYPLSLIAETDMPQLECGYDYAWRVDAREVIDGYNDGGNQGIWGWPDWKKSEVRQFTWGKNPEELVVSPVINNEVTDVLPLFIWDDNIGCWLIFVYCC